MGAERSTDPPSFLTLPGGAESGVEVDIEVDDRPEIAGRCAEGFSGVLRLWFVLVASIIVERFKCVPSFLQWLTGGRGEISAGRSGNARHGVGCPRVDQQTVARSRPPRRCLHRG